MNCKASKVDWSASYMKREIIMKAGEWLERANLQRGRWNGDEIQKVEGVPEKYQPNQKIILSETKEKQDG